MIPSKAEGNVQIPVQHRRMERVKRLCWELSVGSLGSSVIPARGNSAPHKQKVPPTKACESCHGNQELLLKEQENHE